MLPRVPTITWMEPILWIVLSSELSYEIGVLPACPPFSLPRCEPINICPYFCGPLIRNTPHRPLPLIFSLGHEFSQCRLVSQVPGFCKKTLASHPGEVFYQFPHLRLSFWNGGYYILKGNRNNINVLPNLRHCAITLIRPKIESQQSNC